MSPADPPVRFRWQTRGYLLAGAGIAFLAIALIARDSVVVLIAIPLLVAPVAAALVAARPSPTASLAWSAGGEEGRVVIRGELRGHPASSTENLTVQFHRPADLSEEAPPRFEWWPGVLRFELTWRAPRPTVGIVPAPTVEWRDPIGLVERSAGGLRAGLLVERYPLDLYRIGAVRLERTRPLPGKTRTRHIGASGEFFGIRNAMWNEPPRHINWRASARAGRWLANEFEIERTGDLILLIDTRPTELGPVVDQRFLGVARAAATGIAGAFLRQKARVGYASFGEFLQAVPLSTGRTQEVRIRHAIRSTRYSPIEGPSERCAVSLRRFYPPGITTLLLSTLAGDVASDLVVYLKRRGFPVVVLNPSWRSLVPRRGLVSPHEDRLLTRLGHLERRVRLASARVFASVVDWEDLANLGDLSYALQHPTRGPA